MNEHMSASGTYVLLLESNRSTELNIGRLGKFVTGCGYYLYVGSAFGPGGIRARVKHHNRPVVRPHWHIDYLRSAAGLIAAWCGYGVRVEHRWAQALARSGAVVVPIPGFGASDCDCASHLFFLDHRPDVKSLENILDAELAVIDLSGMQNC